MTMLVMRYKGECWNWMFIDTNRENKEVEQGKHDISIIMEWITGRSKLWGMSFTRRISKIITIEIRFFGVRYYFNFYLAGVLRA